MKTTLAALVATGALLLGSACGQETVPAGPVTGPTTEPTPEPTPDPVPEPTPDPAPEPTPEPVPCDTTTDPNSRLAPSCADPRPEPGPGPSTYPAGRPSIEDLYSAVYDMEHYIESPTAIDYLANCMSELLYFSDMSNEALWSAVYDDQDYQLSAADEAAVSQIEDDMIACFTEAMDLDGQGTAWPDD